MKKFNKGIPKSVSTPCVKIASRKDVARYAGVSPAAVSQVLNNLPNTRISPAVRKKIFDAVRQLGYRPHPIARALVAGKTSIIGILLFHLGSPFSRYAASLLNASWNQLKESAHKMQIDCKEIEDDVSTVFIEEGWCDGYIVVAPPLRLRGAETIPVSPHACVCIGSRPDGVAISYTDTDNREVGRLAVSYLFEKGHRKIAHITGPLSGISSARDRFDGYVQGLKEHGLPYRENLVVNGAFRSDRGGLAMVDLLGRGEKFTAVFSANDAMAVGAIAEAQSRGLSVPNDISVLGVSDTLISGEDAFRSLTTIEQPLDKVGAEAAAILLKHLSEEPYLRRPIIKLFPGKVVERATVSAL